MKTIIALLLILLPGSLMAAQPSNDDLINELLDTRGKLVQAKAEADAAKSLFDPLLDRLLLIDQAANQKDATIAVLNKQHDQDVSNLEAANGWATKLQLLIFCGIGGVLVVGVIIIVAMRLPLQDAILCGMGAVVSFGAAQAIQHYGEQYAIASFISVGVAFVALVVYGIFRVHQNEVAAKDNGSAPNQLFNANFIAAADVPRAKALLAEARGKMATKLAKAATVTSQPAAVIDAEAAIPAVAARAA